MPDTDEDAEEIAGGEPLGGRRFATVSFSGGPLPNVPVETKSSASPPESPEHLARELFAAIDARDRAAVAERLHPEAELEMAMALGRTIRGREAVLETLEAAWDRVHSLRIDEAEVLSPTTVLLGGRSRYPIGHGGFADTGVFWLCTYRGDMLWRQRVFETREQALEAWETVRATEPTGPG